MRCLGDVLEEILTLIPESEKDFREDMQSLLQSVHSSSPEIMYLRWRTGAEYMSDHISQDEKDWSDWQSKVVCIWMGDTPEQ